MDKWIIYGIVEPETRKIVYIDFYIDEDNNYINKDDKVFLDSAIENMREENNPYRIDLINMWNASINIYNIETKIVALDILEDDKEICEITDAYRKLFKPKFCMQYYNDSSYSWRLCKDEEDKCSETDKYIKNGWLKYNGKEWVFTSPELENMWYGVDEDKE